MSLAQATLLHDWRRYAPGVVSVAFSGLLMLIQLGLLLGMFGTLTVLIDRSPAPLWIGSSATVSFDQARPIPAALAAVAQSDGAVTATESLKVEGAEWRSASGARLEVNLVSLRPARDALACPTPQSTSWCDALAAPMTAAVDRADLGKLGAAAGELVEINGQRVRLVATTEGLGSIGEALVFVSDLTARRLARGLPPEGEQASFVLARLAPGRSVAGERAALQALLGRQAVRVWTGPELSAASQRYWLTESGVGMGFLFSSLLGLIIGVVITGQTLRAAVLGNLREFAVLRALGVPARALGGVVVEQSLWIAGLGVLLMLGLTAGAVALADLLGLRLVLTAPAVGSAVGLGVLTALASGLYALRELYRLEPATVLR